MSQEALQEYTKQLYKLHEIILAGRDFDPEYDKVCDSMKAPWEKMTEEEQVIARQYASDLWDAHDSKKAELEETRQQAVVTSFGVVEGAGERDHFSPGSHGFHELLHTSSLLVDMWDGYVLNHQACLLDANLYAEASMIMDKLIQFYQRVAQKHI